MRLAEDFVMLSDTGKFVCYAAVTKVVFASAKRAAGARVKGLVAGSNSTHGPVTGKRAAGMIVFV